MFTLSFLLFYFYFYLSFILSFILYYHRWAQGPCRPNTFRPIYRPNSGLKHNSAGCQAQLTARPALAHQRSPGSPGQPIRPQPQPAGFPSTSSRAQCQPVTESKPAPDFALQRTHVLHHECPLSPSTLLLTSSRVSCLPGIAPDWLQQGHVPSRQNLLPPVHPTCPHALHIWRAGAPCQPCTSSSPVGTWYITPKSFAPL